jgi:diadenylate cyclase
VDFSTSRTYILGVVQIIVLAFPLYYLLKFLRRTKGYRILLGICIVLVGLSIAARELELDVIGWLLDRIAAFLPLAMVIIFQPELRRVFAEIGSRATPKPQKPETDVITEIKKAVDLLASQRIGALIAIERGVNLDHYTRVGRELNAPVVSELLATLFYPHTPMHDGGVIIRDGVILSAGCVFPIGALGERRKAFGTRHRAAIGLSEETDALVIVVSEETGLISVAYGGEIVRGLDIESLGRVLESGIGSRDESTTAESIDSVRETKAALDEVDQVAAAIARIKEEA